MTPSKDKKYIVSEYGHDGHKYVLEQIHEVDYLGITHEDWLVFGKLEPHFMTWEFSPSDYDLERVDESSDYARHWSKYTLKEKTDRVCVEYKAPQKWQNDKFSIFLAGTIDMGASINWQNQLVEEFANYDVNFINPRRDDWDNSWEQRIFDINFKNQVTWEIESLDRCDLIIMNLLPNSKSPISLLELGLFANTGKLVICCPDGFWRKGNIEVVCLMFSIKLVDNYEDLYQYVRTNIEIDAERVNEDD